MYLKLDITSVSKQPGASVPFDFTVAWKDLACESDVLYDGDVQIQGRAANVGEGVFDVSAHIAAVFHGECARCLEPVSVPVDFDLCERFVKDAGEDSDSYSFTNDTIVLDDFVREALLLEVPTKVLCSPDCLGLCPVCGQNRNKNPHCSCIDNAGPTGPMAALAALLNDDDEEV